MAKKLNKHYKTDDKKKKIIVREISDLTKKEKDEVKFLMECGYALDITHAEKPKTEPKPGFSKIEKIYYLEVEAPADKVKEYIELCDKEVNDGGGFMRANKVFNAWFEENKAKPDPKDSSKKLSYNGEAADLIKKNGEAAKKRIEELTKADEEKKRIKAEEKKKNK